MVFRKRILGILLLVIIVSVSYMSLGNTKSRTTETWSKQFQKREDKIVFLQKYIKTFSTIVDTEFYINYFDNSVGIIPGPSDWEMRVALIVPEDSVKNWTEGFHEVKKDEIEMNWWNDLPLTTEEWQRSSTPKFYKRPNEQVYLVVYSEEGIILKRISSL